MDNTATMKNKTTSINKTRIMTVTAVLAAMSYVLQLFDFPIPFAPSFVKMDFSDLPALIGAFAFGPLVGVLVELVKNLLHLTSTSTGGIGEAANFLMGGAFVFTAGAIYRTHKSKKMAFIAGVIGSVVMGVVAVFANYFVLLPLYEKFMPIEQIIAAFSSIFPFIHTKLDAVLLNMFPFNIVKGVVITAVTMLIYKRISPILKGTV
jgi:riboflavin transporter FmnP